MDRMSGFAAMFAAALLAACGPGGGSKITAMINSCDVLSAVDAPALIGVAFDAPESLRDQDAGENAGKMSSCGLTSTSPEQDPSDLGGMAAQMRNTWFITFMAWTWPGEDNARGYMDSMRQSDMLGAAPETVDGLGDDAVWNGTMHVRRGNVTISMDVRGPTDESGERSEKDLETELSKRALKHMK